MANSILICAFTILLLSTLPMLCLSALSEWSRIGYGVSYRFNSNPTTIENNVLITYAGYNVNENLTKAWTERLYAKSFLSMPLYSFNHQYAVQGPKDVSYASLEIENSKLLADLFARFSNSDRVSMIVVIAHSSGSYVADELFTQFYNRITQAASSSDPVLAATGQKLSQKIFYYNLDGAITPSRKDNLYLSKLFSKIYFVWASKGTMQSMNAGSMLSGPSYFPSALAKSIEVKGTKSTCLNGRCLHDVVITQVPFDPSNFNTDKDYSSFTDYNEVQFDYLTQTI